MEPEDCHHKLAALLEIGVNLFTVLYTDCSRPINAFGIKDEAEDIFIM